MTHRLLAILASVIGVGSGLLTFSSAFKDSDYRYLPFLIALVLVIVLLLLSRLPTMVLRDFIRAIVKSR